MHDGRIVKVKIEMDLLEYEHFNHGEDERTDEEALALAKMSFVNDIFAMAQMVDGYDKISEYVQASIVKE